LSNTNWYNSSSERTLQLQTVYLTQTHFPHPASWLQSQLQKQKNFRWTRQVICEKPTTSWRT